jgi:hypothetical protein
MVKNILPVEELAAADKINFLYTFFSQHTLAALATVSKNNKPEVAIVEFSVLANLELIFDTYSTFRKYNNLLANPSIALVIGWDKNITVQYEGDTLELKGNELETCRNIHLKRFPDAIKFEQYFGMKYFKITPAWIRYLDTNLFPWKKVELQFSNG